MKYFLVQFDLVLTEGTVPQINVQSRLEKTPLVTYKPTKVSNEKSNVWASILENQVIGSLLIDGNTNDERI